MLQTLHNYKTICYVDIFLLLAAQAMFLLGGIFTNVHSQVLKEMA